MTNSPDPSVTERVALLPCPFCGGKANPQKHRIAEDAMVAFVHCLGCGTSTEQFEDAYAPTGQAIDAWNTRAAISPMPALEEENARLREALQALAEGNLGHEAWQANYDRIREYAAAALSPRKADQQVPRTIEDVAVSLLTRKDGSAGVADTKLVELLHKVSCLLEVIPSALDAAKDVNDALAEEVWALQQEVEAYDLGETAQMSEAVSASASLTPKDGSEEVTRLSCGGAWRGCSDDKCRQFRICLDEHEAALKEGASR